MNQMSFVKHFLIIGSGTVFNLLIGILTTPVITRLVAPSIYGQLSIFNTYSGIATMVLCLGLDQSLVRFYYGQNTEEYHRALLFRCVLPSCMITVFAEGIFLLLIKLGLVQLDFSLNIAPFLCIYVLIQIIYRFSILLVRLEFNSKLFSVLGMIQKGLYAATAVSLLFFVNGNDLSILIFATIFSALVCMVISIGSQCRLWNICKNNESICMITKRELIRYGSPFIISLGITTLFQSIDQIFLKTFCDYNEVGIYASAGTILSVFAIVQSTFNTLWSPMAVEHYAKDPEDRKFYERGNQIITVLMFFMGMSLMLCKDIFALLLGEKYRETAYILPFLIFNPIMYTVSETTVTGLVLMKKSVTQILVAFVPLVTNIIGNAFLVPQLGARGAAISTGLSYIVFFTMRTMMANRYFKANYQLNRFYSITVLLCVYAIYNTFYRFGLYSIIGYLICSVALLTLYNNAAREGIGMLITWVYKFRGRISHND